MSNNIVAEITKDKPDYPGMCSFLGLTRLETCVLPYRKGVFLNNPSEIRKWSVILATQGQRIGNYFTHNLISENSRFDFNKPKVISGKGNLTGNPDISHRISFLIDVDAAKDQKKKGGGNVPTSFVTNHIEPKAETIKDVFHKHGFAYMECYTGNGIQYLCPIQAIESTTAVTKAAIDIYTVLKSYIDDEFCEIDPSVNNPARLCRLPGTLACKGDNEEFHRWTRATCFDGKRPTFEEFEKAIYEAFPKKEDFVSVRNTEKVELRNAVKSASGKPEFHFTWIQKWYRDKIEDLIQDLNLEHLGMGEYQGSTLWHVKCPNIDNHSTKDTDSQASLFVNDQGYVTKFKCFHGGCELNITLGSIIEKEKLAERLKDETDDAISELQRSQGDEAKDNYEHCLDLLTRHVGSFYSTRKKDLAEAARNCDVVPTLKTVRVDLQDKMTAWKRQHNAAIQVEDGKVVIDYGVTSKNSTGDAVGEETMDALLDVNKDEPQFFRSRGGMAIIKSEHLKDNDGNAYTSTIITPFGNEDSYSRIRSRLNKHIKYRLISQNEDPVVQMEAPIAVCRYLVHDADHQSLPHLRSISNFPLLVKDGIVDGRQLFRVVATNGFDRQSGYYTNLGGVEIKNIGITKAFDELNKLVETFPTGSFADKVNALSLMFTPPIRPALNVESTVPVHVATAGKHGAGKSYLHLAMLSPLVGHVIPAIPGDTRNVNEFQNRLDSAMMHGYPIVVVDNATDVIAAKFTAHVSAPNLFIRKYHTQETILVENLTTFALSAKNVKLSEEVMQRSVVSKITAYKDVKDRDLQYLVAQSIKDRSVILSAIYTILDEWTKAGCNLGNQNHRMRNWAQIIGGIFSINSDWSKAFLSNQDEVAIDPDSPRQIYAEGFTALLDRYGAERCKYGLQMKYIMPVLSHVDEVKEIDETYPGWESDIEPGYFDPLIRSDQTLNSRRAQLGKHLTDHCKEHPFQRFLTGTSKDPWYVFQKIRNVNGSATYQIVRLEGDDPMQNIRIDEEGNEVEEQIS